MIDRIAFPDRDIKLIQGFSTLALLTFRAGEFFTVEVCPVHQRTLSSISGLCSQDDGTSDKSHGDGGDENEQIKDI